MATTWASEKRRPTIDEAYDYFIDDLVQHWTPKNLELATIVAQTTFDANKRTILTIAEEYRNG